MTMKFLKKILQIPPFIINTILLSIVYFVGMGLSFILHKFSKKKLFNLKKQKSYWINYSKDNKFYRMY
jgi:hypothetical protein